VRDSPSLDNSVAESVELSDLVPTDAVPISVSFGADNQLMIAEALSTSAVVSTSNAFTDSFSVEIETATEDRRQNVEEELSNAPQLSNYEHRTDASSESAEPNGSGFEETLCELFPEEGVIVDGSNLSDVIPLDAEDPSLSAVPDRLIIPGDILSSSAVASTGSLSINQDGDQTRMEPPVSTYSPESTEPDRVMNDDISRLPRMLGDSALSILIPPDQADTIACSEADICSIPGDPLSSSAVGSASSALTIPVDIATQTHSQDSEQDSTEIKRIEGSVNHETVDQVTLLDDSDLSILIPSDKGVMTCSISGCPLSSSAVGSASSALTIPMDVMTQTVSQHSEKDDRDQDEPPLTTRMLSDSEHNTSSPPDSAELDGKENEMIQRDHLSPDAILVDGSDLSVLIPPEQIEPAKYTIPDDAFPKSTVSSANSAFTIPVNIVTQEESQHSDQDEPRATARVLSDSENGTSSLPDSTGSPTAPCFEEEEESPNLQQRSDCE
jgi:hypothetical protein